jgi:hypothetical protein
MSRLSLRHEAGCGGGGNEYYPDAFVVCGAPMLANRRALDDAVLVCEVRSDSTAAFDMGEKFAAYQQLPSLREYLLLDTRRPEATLSRKDAQGGWSSRTIAGEEMLVLESVGLRVPLAQLYARLTLDDEPRASAGSAVYRDRALPHRSYGSTRKVRVLALECALESWHTCDTFTWLRKEGAHATQ